MHFTTTSARRWRRAFLAALLLLAFGSSAIADSEPLGFEQSLQIAVARSRQLA
ncbi:hypothetical protein LP420_38285 [Massilia sp. B-10]|nr:hypothetical protein LP420_38285 [Massilia sp. B-10]UUZ54115.1 hypothetical protein LP419_37725 [Massilia sp. H-1]